MTYTLSNQLHIPMCCVNILLLNTFEPMLIACHYITLHSIDSKKKKNSWSTPSFQLHRNAIFSMTTVLWFNWIELKSKQIYRIESGRRNFRFKYRLALLCLLHRVTEKKRKLYAFHFVRVSVVNIYVITVNLYDTIYCKCVRIGFELFTTLCKLLWKTHTHRNSLIIPV